MSNRWFRFVIALLALAIAGAAGYRIYQQEQRLASDSAATRRGVFAAERAIAAVSDIKAAMHAYVAAGQGHAFWTSRTTMLIDALRAAVLGAEGPVMAAGGSLSEALDLTDRLAAADQRAREHVTAGEALLAGDVIFTEARDVLDALRIQVARGRDQLLQASDRRTAETRNAQMTYAAAAAGVMALALLLLVPIGRRDAVSGPATLSVTAPTMQLTPANPPQLETPARLALDEAATLCTDLGRLSDSAELSTLLARAADVLGASGIIVWMAAADGRELHPAASTGYDERLFARIGRLSRDASNITAAAYRDRATRTTEAIGPTAAALAAPIVGTAGPVGVFTAELREGVEADQERAAIATIIAAQLATLLGSMSTSDDRAAAQA